MWGRWREEEMVHWWRVVCMALNFQQLRLSMLRNGSLLRSLVMSLFIALKHNKSRSDVTLPQSLLLLVHHHHLLISAQQNNRQWKFLCMTCSLLNLNTRDRTRLPKQQRH